MVILWGFACADVCHDSWLMNLIWNWTQLPFMHHRSLQKNIAVWSFSFWATTLCRNNPSFTSFCTGQPLIRVKCFGIFSLNNGDEIYKLYILFILYYNGSHPVSNLWNIWCILCPTYPSGNAVNVSFYDLFCRWPKQSFSGLLRS